MLGIHDQVVDHNAVDVFVIFGIELGIKPFCIGVKTQVNPPFAAIGDGIAFDAAIAGATLGVDARSGNVVDFATFDQHIGCVDIIDAFGVEVQLSTRAFAAVVNFTIEDFDALTSRGEFDGIPPGIVNDAVAYGDIAGASSFGERYRVVPIPIAFKFETVIVTADNFQAFEGAAVGFGFVVPKAGTDVLHIGYSGDDGPFIGVRANGQVAFVDADFVGSVFAAA